MLDEAIEYIKTLQLQLQVCEFQFSRYVAEGLGSLRFNTLSWIFPFFDLMEILTRSSCPMHGVVGLVDDVNKKWNEPTTNGSAFWNSTSADAADASNGDEHGCGHGHGDGFGNGHGGHGCNWLRSRVDTSDICYRPSSATQLECTRHDDGST
jgi:hypothetical protein